MLSDEEKNQHYAIWGAQYVDEAEECRHVSILCRLKRLIRWCRLRLNLN